MTAPYPCPSCGFLVFAEPAGSYAICPICDWEDDVVQLEAPGYAGGANHDSLYNHQQGIALMLVPFGIDLFRGYRRAPGWRPVRPEEALAELPDPRADLDDERIYYWRRSHAAI